MELVTTKSDHKLEKAKMIIASLLVRTLFIDWEMRSEPDIAANIKKISDDLQLDLSPSVQIKTMITYGMIHHNNDYNGYRYFSTKKNISLPTAHSKEEGYIPQ